MVQDEIKSPRERWIELKAHMKAEINKIDEDTAWQESEPEWWLEMSDVERKLNNSKIK